MENTTQEETGAQLREQLLTTRTNVSRSETSLVEREPFVTHALVRRDLRDGDEEVVMRHCNSLFLSSTRKQERGKQFSTPVARILE